MEKKNNFYIFLVRFILLIIIIFLAVYTSYAASLIGTDALGMDLPPRNAAMIRNGFAPQNPAVNAFENKTKFGAEILYEHAEAQSSESAISLNSFTVPYISMVLPMGFLGAFGIGLEQKFSANNRLELIDAALNANVSLSSRVGLYVLSPSYSIRLPFFLSDFSLGTTYRIFFGNSYSTLERGISNTQPDDAWMSRNITKKETANFESDGDWWRNFGYSMHFHRKSIDYFFSYFPYVQMQRNVKENIRFSNTDTLNSKEFKDGFKIPKYFASGIHFRFWQNQNLSLMYEQQNFEKSFEKSRLDANTGEAVSYFAEYKITGTGLYYSTFLKRNNFGMNVWYSEKYLKDVNEYGTSLFSDMWIGRRGTLVGFALFGGYREAKTPYWAEPFFGFKLNLTGVGNWGTSARRK